MQARRLTPSDLATTSPDQLAGAVLLAPVRLPGGQLRKGTRLDADVVARLQEAARTGALLGPVRLAHPEPDELHEDEAAARLAKAVAGPGVVAQPPRQSRLDLADLAHGGILGPAMRFRFPAYARDLRAPEG